MKNLRKDKSLIITRADKGNCVVILNKCDYVNKIEDILNDKPKFTLIKGSCFKYTIVLEDKLDRTLRKIKNKLPENTYNTLFASGSTPGNLHGLPKIQKERYPMRPIILAINTFNCILG